MPGAIYLFEYRSPLGNISIASNGSYITNVVIGHIDEAIIRDPSLTSARLKPDQLTNTCATKLLEYFAGKRTFFDIPIQPKGTDFQKSVWAETETIPYGQTMTASDLAYAMGRPNSNRKIGTAIMANPIAILIPTHRIVSSNKTYDRNKEKQLQAVFRELEAKYA